MLLGREIHKSAGKKTILEGIGLRVPAGSVQSFLGPSGGGKSTLLRILMGLETHDKGEISFRDRLLSRDGRLLVPPERRGFTMLSQDFTLFPHLDVFANVSIGLSALSPREKKDLAAELMETMEIGHLARRRIHELSGGEQQRVALARTLSLRPEVLLLDEPFSNVDRMRKERLYGHLKDWLARHRITVLIATHDHGEAFFFSDRVTVIRKGKILDENTPEELYKKPRTEWVARFIGEVNFLSAEELGRAFSLAGGELRPDLKYLVRPEEFEIVGNAEGAAAAEVIDVSFYGSLRRVRARMKNGRELRILELCRGKRSPGEAVGLRIAKPAEELSAAAYPLLSGEDPPPGPPREAS